jgi:uncharacterized protein (DUF2141 family)
MLIKKGLILFVFAFIVMSCARVVMPPGGPVDKSAPIAERTSPENRSTHFNADKVVIDFDEYVELKNFNQEFVSSPLFKEKPEKILRGKSLILKFDKDSLEANTTYTLDFGNSIIDFRAGNILENYQYVFSTGDLIDSLSISGHVFWAEDLSPQAQIWVLLYKDYNDTSLATTRPNFVAKTNAEGHFSINNIAPGTYGMAALKDINSNYIFDLPNEQIAFLDTVFELKIIDHSLEIDTSATVLDSLSLDSDSVLVFADTLKQDSAMHYHTTPEHIDLFMFEEAFQNIYLLDESRPNPYLIQLVFSQSTDSVVAFEFENTIEANIIVEPSLSKDTFNIWLLDSLLSKDDTLEMYLGYHKTDSTQNLVWAWDTLSLKNAIKKEIKRKKKDIDTLPEPRNYLSLTTNVKSQTVFDFYKAFRIKSDFPILSFDTTKVHLYELQDTNFVDLEYQIYQDSIKLREYVVDYKFEADKSYRIEVEPDAFLDYRNLSNDTLDFTFKTKSLETYTEILLNVSAVDSNQLIIELLDTKGAIVKSEIINSAQVLTFSYLKPGNYTCKAILDVNKNGVWDTGDFKLKRQAEKVSFYSETIATKANWSHDIQWVLNFGFAEHQH